MRQVEDRGGDMILTLNKLLTFFRNVFHAFVISFLYLSKFPFIDNVEILCFFTGINLNKSGSLFAS